jgi:DNA sulfur modification protein DndD
LIIRHLGGVDRLKVVRLWRITGKGVSEETKVYRESHDDAELTATWNERVEDIIPLGISNLFFFDGEQVRELATATKATPEVQLAIRTLLGLDLPQQLQTDLSVIVTRRQKSRINDETKRTAVEALENEIRSAESMRIASFEKLAQLRNALIIAEKNLEVKRQEFVIRGGDTANRRSEIDEEIARLKVQSSANRERIRELLSGSLPLGLARDLLERALTRATTEREHLDSRLIQELIEERDGRILASLDSGKFPKKARDFLREVLDQDRSTRFIPLGSEPYLNASREGIALANANLNDAIEVVSKQTGEALHGINTTETQLQALEAKLAVAAPSEQAQSQLLQVETASNEVAKIRVEIDRTQTIYDESVSKVERLRAKLERALRDLATDQGLQAEDSRVIAAAERVMGVMERFKSSLLAKRVHDLERRTLEFFSSLARKRGPPRKCLLERADL